MTHRPLSAILFLALTACSSGQPAPTSTVTDAPVVSASTSAPRSSPATPGPPATSPPVPPPNPVADGFERVARFPERAAGPPAGLVAWRHGFAAAGTISGLFVSADGHQWEQVEPSGVEGALLWRLISTADGRLLAFGSPGALQAPGPSEDFTAWISSDARSWEVIDLGFPASFVVRDVAIGPLGMVLVGSNAEDPLAGAVEELWFSTNGVAWRRTFATTRDAMLVAAGAGPEGFVAVGQHGWESNQGRGLVLASSDGIAWLEAESESGALSDTPSLWSIAPLGADWLTVPVAQNGQAMVLHSQDGLAWRTGPPLSLDSYLEGHTAGLETDGRRVFLHVPVAADTEPRPPSLWVSSDGEAWQPLGIDVLEGAVLAAANEQTTVLMVTTPEGDLAGVEFWVESGG